MASYHVNLGPSRECLFDALRLCGEKRKVCFVFDSDRKREIYITIDSIKATERDGWGWGDGENWEIYGRERECESNRSVHILFNTVNRTGLLDFTDSD